MKTRKQLEALKNEYEIEVTKYKEVNTEVADKEILKYEIIIKKIDYCLVALDRFEYEIENLENHYQ